MLSNKNFLLRFFGRVEIQETISAESLQYMKDQHRELIANSRLFLKLVQYNTRHGLKLKTLNTYLKLVQVFFKIFKIMSRKRRRRVQRYVIFKQFEYKFQKILNLRQLVLTKKLVRKRGRHKNFEYNFVPLYKNKQINQLMYWLRLLSFKYSSRRYLTRLVYVYYDFLFFADRSYTVKLHKSLRMEYFLKKKKKFKDRKYIKKRMYLGKISKI